ncbi:MAG: thiamine-phosphate kinase [Thaumarchaeota archaeon]|nr:thiamine-phosphate kinase [Nitrososphaerota archaeon]
MTKLNEQQIIKIFQNKLGKRKFVPEDVEIFNFGKTNCIVNVDTLVESTDIPPRTKISDAARKSLVACVSDFAAKGVKPLFGTISVTIPRSYSKSKISELSEAIGKAAKEFDVKILGGDTNEGKELVIQVSLIGFSDRIIRRRGARIGDVVFVTGPFGYTTAGLKILLEKKKSNKNFEKKAKLATLRPKSKLKFGLKAKKYFSSSMDSSDGLSTTLNQLSKQSKHRFVILKIPGNSDLFEFAKLNKLNAYNLIFNGGEEFEIVFTSSPKNRTKITHLARKLKVPLIEIGYVTKGSGVAFLQNGKTYRIKDSGWQHFRS